MAQLPGLLASQGGPPPQQGPQGAPGGDGLQALLQTLMNMPLPVLQQVFQMVMQQKMAGQGQGGQMPPQGQQMPGGGAGMGMLGR